MPRSPRLLLSNSYYNVMMGVMAPLDNGLRSFFCSSSFSLWENWHDKSWATGTVIVAQALACGID